MKTLLIITAYIAPFLFIPAVFKWSGSALGNLSGSMSGRMKGFSGRQKQFRGKTRADNWSSFKRGERGGKLTGGKYSRALGRGIGTISDTDKTKRMRLLAPTRRGRMARGDALAHAEGLKVAENLRTNSAVQNMAQTHDEAAAVIALSGGTAQGAKQAAQQLRDMWLQTANSTLADDAAIDADMTLTDDEKISQKAANNNTRTANAVTADQRRDEALRIAHTMPINRINAMSMLTAMGQNKSRAIDAGRMDIVNDGIARLGTGAKNSQQVADLRNGFQYHSRAAMRFDLGAGRQGLGSSDGTNTGPQEVLAGLNRAGIYALANSHPDSIAGGAAAATTLATNTGSSDEEMQQVAVFYQELEAALPNATGEIRDAIVTALAGAGAEASRNWVSAGRMADPAGGFEQERVQVATTDPATGETITRTQLRDTTSPRTINPREDGVRTARRVADPYDPRRDTTTTPPTPTIPSDRRLKKDIKLITITRNNLKLYEFRYLWSEQIYVGVMAQDLVNTHPEALLVDSFGYYSVDYACLGIKMMTIEEWNVTKILTLV